MRVYLKLVAMVTAFGPLDKLRYERGAIEEEGRHFRHRFANQKAINYIRCPSVAAFPPAAVLSIVRPNGELPE